jgi:hypothetical protein
LVARYPPASPATTPAAMIHRGQTFRSGGPIAGNAAGADSTSISPGADAITSTGFPTVA